MYIKNNRLYDNGVSFEIPKDVRINIDSSGAVAFFREDELWYLSVDIWKGAFGEKELGEFISDLFENNSIGALRTSEKTVNGVFMRQACYDFADYPNEPSFICFLNSHAEGDAYWVHCRVWGSVYDRDPASGKKIEDHPVISAFINSARKEPFEKSYDIPPCVIEMRKLHRGLQCDRKEVAVK